jgi:hypothetical protein
MAARTSHQSFVTLPVLVPPWNVKPCAARTVKLASTPSKTRVSSPTSFVDRITLLTWPNTLGLMSYSWLMVDPLFGSRGSLGTASVKADTSFGPIRSLSVTVPLLVNIVKERR